MQAYSCIIPETQTANSCATRRSNRNDLIGKLSLRGSLTLFETFNKSGRLYSRRPCLGERHISSVDGTPTLFSFKSYSEVLKCIRDVSSGFVKEGLLQSKNPNNLPTFGLFLKNCAAWIIAEQACYAQSAVTVPLYDTLGPEPLQYIINQTGMSSILCSIAELPVLLRVCSSCPQVKTIIVKDTRADITEFFDKHRREGVSLSEGLRLMTFEELARIGAAHPVDPRPPSPHDLATICYTSGTTGKPKGAMITHQNIIAVSAAGLESCMKVIEKDVYLSFLPLPHIFERIVTNSLLACGASIGFYRGDTLKIGEDLLALQPTVLCAVPRLYNRIYDKINQKIASTTGIAGNMLRTAVTAKLQVLRETGSVSHSVWDPLVFNKMKKALGMQRIRLMLSGGAPLPVRTMEFFRILLGAQCTCHEGYGQTETSGATSLSMPGDLDVGHVGGPLPCCEVMLVDVPEMNYLSTDRFHGTGDSRVPCVGRGEVWVRGPSVISGYYRDPEETAAAGLDGVTSGKAWLRSGDIGMWTPKGQLAIIDRMKNIFKLSQGEYVAVEKVEGVLGQASLVSQIFVYGDSKEDKLVAVVVPDEEVLAAKGLRSVSTTATAKGTGGDNNNSNNINNNNNSNSSSNSTASNKALSDVILEELTSVGKAADLKGFELVHAVHVEPVPWTPESGLLTPTMKLKRVDLQQKYANEIQGMYQRLRGHGKGGGEGNQKEKEAEQDAVRSRL